LCCGDPGQVPLEGSAKRLSASGLQHITERVATGRAVASANGSESSCTTRGDHGASEVIAARGANPPNSALDREVDVSRRDTSGSSAQLQQATAVPAGSRRSRAHLLEPVKRPVDQAAPAPARAGKLPGRRGHVNSRRQPAGANARGTGCAAAEYSAGFHTRRCAQQSRHDVPGGISTEVRGDEHGCDGSEGEQLLVRHLAGTSGRTGASSPRRSRRFVSRPPRPRVRLPISRVTSGRAPCCPRQPAMFAAKPGAHRGGTSPPPWVGRRGPSPNERASPQCSRPSSRAIGGTEVPRAPAGAGR